LKPSSSITKTRLKNCRQQSGELLSIFSDAIIEPGKKLDRQMLMYMIVDYLVVGVRNDLRIHVHRRLASTTEPLTVGLFLSIAGDEDKLKNELYLIQPPSTFSQPYLEQVAAVTYRPSLTHHLPIDRPHRSSNHDWSSLVQMYRPVFDFHSFDSSNYQLSSQAT
jgi:hypothetical protein